MSDVDRTNKEDSVLMNNKEAAASSPGARAEEHRATNRRTGESD